MGGLIKFPRNGVRRGAAEWNDRDSAPMTRTDHEASLITWIDAKRSHDGDDDNDSGGGSAA